MCISSLFGGGGSSSSGASAAQASEKARQARIDQGTTQVNSDFNKKFTPGFYDQQRQAYSDYYLPQIDKQYQDAHNQLILNLAHAGGGNIGSSEAARQLGNLNLTYQQQRTSAANNAVSFASTARTNVEDARSALLNQLSASADPTSAAIGATGRIASLATPPAFSPLGNLFATAAPALVPQSSQPTLVSPAMFGVGPSVGGGGGGSSMVVA